MPEGWQWDETLFRGSAAFYARGRLPYAPGMADAIAQTLALDGGGRLLDVGCGPGIIALRLAQLFAEVVGVDADTDMVAEAARRAAELGIANARWLRARAEDLPVRAGAFRVATFGQSFHWMERDRVAAAIFTLLEPGGAFVQVGERDPQRAPNSADRELPYPQPPSVAIQQLVQRYLGPVRRAGRGLLRHGTDGGEAEVLARAGFDPPEIVFVAGAEYHVRTLDDQVATCLAHSWSAPHLFGERLPAFEADLRAVLAEASPAGLFAIPAADTELRFWRMPLPATGR